MAASYRIYSLEEGRNKRSAVRRSSSLSSRRQRHAKPIRRNALRLLRPALLLGSGGLRRPNPGTRISYYRCSLPG
jgi:hypothetical protein